VVEPEDDIMMITSDGVIIRTDASEISEYGRVTQGVRVMRLEDGIAVTSIERCAKEEEDDAEPAEQETPAENTEE